MPTSLNVNTDIYVTLSVVLNDVIDLLYLTLNYCTPDFDFMN